MEAKGLKLPKVYDPDVVEFAKKAQDPAKDLCGFGQTLNRSRRRRRLHVQHPVELRRGRVGQGRQARARHRPSSSRTPAALQFAVDTIKKHGIQPPGVMGWTDVSNNESYMAGKLVTTNNGASLYYAMVSKKHELAAKTLCVLTPGGPAGSFVGSSCYNWAIFQKTPARRAGRGPDPLPRGREAVRGVHAGLGRPGGPGLQGPRGQPVLEVGSELRRDAAEHPAQREHRLSRPHDAGRRRGAGRRRS